MMLQRHVVIYLFAHAVPAMLGFIGLIIYTHLISPEQDGVYVVGQSTAGIISMALFGWIRLSASRYQAESDSVDVRGTVIVAYGVTLAVVGVGSCIVLTTVLRHEDQL